MVRACAVKTCKNNSRLDMPFFQLPTDPERCLQWISLAGNPALVSSKRKTTVTKQLTKSYQICGKHFKPEEIFTDIRTYRYSLRERKTALPSLFLPEALRVVGVALERGNYKVIFAEEGQKNCSLVRLTETPVSDKIIEAPSGDKVNNSDETPLSGKVILDDTPTSNKASSDEAPISGKVSSVETPPVLIACQKPPVPIACRKPPVPIACRVPPIPRTFGVPPIPIACQGPPPLIAFGVLNVGVPIACQVPPIPRTCGVPPVPIACPEPPPLIAFGEAQPVDKPHSTTVSGKLMSKQPDLLIKTPKDLDKLISSIFPNVQQEEADSALGPDEISMDESPEGSEVWEECASWELGEVTGSVTPPPGVQQQCRTCAQQHAALTPIFWGDEQWLSDLVAALTHSQVRPGDCLPQAVCAACLTSLRQVRETALRCQRAETTLREQLGVELDLESEPARECEDYPCSLSPDLEREDWSLDRAPSPVAVAPPPVVAPLLVIPPPAVPAPSLPSVDHEQPTSQPTPCQSMTPALSDINLPRPAKRRKRERETADHSTDSSLFPSRFFCPTCTPKVPLPSALWLLRHLLRRHQRLAVLCTLCGTCLESRDHFREHLALLHPHHASQQTPDGCKLGVTMDDFSVPTPDPSLRRFYTLEEGSIVELTARMDPIEKRKRQTNQTWECCGQTYYTARRYKEHQVRHHNIQCRECDEVFPDAESYAAHQHLHYIERTSEIQSTTFMCEKCGQSFDKKITLSIHLTRQHSTNRIKCEKCKREYSRHRKHNCEKPRRQLCPVCGVICHRLVSHMATHEMGGRHFKCKVCSMTVALYRLEEHLARHLVSNTFTCPHCKENFNKKSSRGSHVDHKLCKRDVDCRVCLIRFPSESELEAHKESHKLEETGQFVCPVCRKYFPVENTEDNAPPGTTEVCGEPSDPTQVCNEPSLSGFPALEQHCTETHTARELELCSGPEIAPTLKRIRKHPCPHCSKTFYNQSLCQKHVIYTHISNPVTANDINQRVLKCDLCDAPPFDGTPEFITHLQSHPVSAFLFKCIFCGKSFKNDYRRKTHEAIQHSTAGAGLEYKCDLCDKSFKTKEYVRNHKARTHKTSSKVLSCAFCTKTYAYKSMLLVHMQAAHDSTALNNSSDQIKPFYCQICIDAGREGNALRVIRSKNLYLVHLVTYHKRKDVRLECSKCDFTCKSISNFTSHISSHGERSRKVTGTGDYNCRACDKHFNSRGTLTRHEATQHEKLREERQDSFPCGVCLKRFSSKSHLTKHEAI